MCSQKSTYLPSNNTVLEFRYLMFCVFYAVALASRHGRLQQIFQRGQVDKKEILILCSITLYYLIIGT